MPGLCGCCPRNRQRPDKYSIDSRNSVPGCPFCAIAEGANQQRVLFQDERLVVFTSIRPQARLHALVIPRTHIANTASMGPEDLALAEEMERVGRQVVGQHAAPGSRLKFGYHVAPWRSVDHLHLHCMALPHVPVWAALKYRLPGVWLSSEALVARLRRGSEPREVQGGV